jgi:hypothetical protein
VRFVRRRPLRVRHRHRLQCENQNRQMHKPTGPLELDFTPEPFDSAMRMLGRSLRLFAANLPFIASVTLAVYLPGKLLTQFIGYILDVPVEGILSYLLLDASDLILGALTVSAIVYGITVKLRSGRTPPVAECLGWGKQLWSRMLWNRFKVEVTILLWSLLIFIPGIIAAVRLSLMEPALAVEGDRCANPLERSRELTAGHGWRIFFALAPLAILDMAGSFLVLDVLAGSPRWMIATGDSLMAVVNGWATIAALLIYLGRLPIRR